MDAVLGSNELILESPLLRLPQEILRTNLKTQQKIIEKDCSWASLNVLALIDTTVAPTKAGDELDVLLVRLRGMKRKVRCNFLWRLRKVTLAGGGRAIRRTGSDSKIKGAHKPYAGSAGSTPRRSRR